MIQLINFWTDLVYNGEYAKSDFIIVRVVDYTIDATAYTNTDADTDTSDIDVTLLRAEK